MVEIELGDELLLQLSKTAGVDFYEESTSAQMKFDDKGNLHILKRNDCGKLMEDVVVRELQTTSNYNDELRRDYAEYKTNNKNKNLLQNILLYGCFGIVGLGVILTFVVIATILGG